MKQTIQLVLLFGASNLFGFEVNTHQAMTRCAIIADTPKCETDGAENLHLFSEHSELDNQEYSSQKFEKYEDYTYQEYTKSGTGLKDWKIKVTSNYLGLVEAGSVLEDSVYHNEDTLLAGGDGRFNNHFYAEQFDSKWECPQILLMKTSKALCLGYGICTDNIDWVFNKDIVLGEGRVNDYGIDDAFRYFQNSFTGTKENMHTNQAKLFVTLGFMVHMLQDLHSPSHVRNGSHPKGDYLEIYARYDGGFNLINGLQNPHNNPYIENAIKDFNINKVMLNDNTFSTYEDFFLKKPNG